jgi:hypothetical protein
LRFSSFLPSVIRSPLGSQLDHELGIPLGSITADDFQLITRIHYIAGTACCRLPARASAAARCIHPLFNTGKRLAHASPQTAMISGVSTRLTTSCSSARYGRWCALSRHPCSPIRCMPSAYCTMRVIDCSHGLVKIVYYLHCSNSAHTPSAGCSYAAQPQRGTIPTIDQSSPPLISAHASFAFAPFFTAAQVEAVQWVDRDGLRSIIARSKAGELKMSPWSAAAAFAVFAASARYRFALPLLCTPFLQCIFVTSCAGVP